MATRRVPVAKLVVCALSGLLTFAPSLWSKPPRTIESAGQGNAAVENGRSGPSMPVKTVASVTAKPLCEILVVSRKIDELIHAELAKHNVKPNPPAGADVFLRRTYLSIVGRIPSYEETRSFLKQRSSIHRSRLIDKLLDSEGYVSHYFNYQADLLRVKSKLRQAPGIPYVNWIKQSLRENKPYDQFVFELLTAEGYTWNHGAAGYYQRDLGMPLDNMSNTVQVFLGTRLVCAQCHDHPYDSWTQRQYYQMAAYTFGVETQRGDPANDRIRKLRELLKAEPPPQRQWINRATNRLVGPLRYHVHETNKVLRLPDDYKHEDAEPNSVVQPEPMFGQPAPVVRGQSRRDAYAKWMTSSQNPRFTMVIANRLWKKVMGVGLIEPVDDVKGDFSQASNPELLRLLTDQMVRLDYDVKQFLRILHNTKTYQRTASRKEWVAGEPYHFPGPSLRRMSAEQIWDSLLTLEIQDPDERKPADSDPWYDYDQLEQRRTSDVEDLLAMARTLGDELYEEDLLRKKKRAIRTEIKVAREANDLEAVQALEKQYRELADSPQPPRMMMEAGEKGPQVETDPRWQGISPDFVRASELHTPAPRGHFLRQFGQSDRQVIDNANVEATVPQILTLLNGPLSRKLVNKNSVLVRHVNAAGTTSEKLDAVFMSIYNRRPTSTEMSIAMQEVKRNGSEGIANVVWALLNTRQFMFIQ